MSDNIDMQENRKIREMINNSREMMKENWYEKDESLAKEEKQILQRELKNFSEYGESLYRDHDLIELSKKLSRLCEFCQRYLNNNADEPFDKVTINRNMKEISKYIDKFEKLAKELKEN